MADISWQDLKALGESLQKKRTDLQQMWREQGDREAYWRRELDAVRATLDETRDALDERETAVAELEGEVVSLREQLVDAETSGASDEAVLALQESLAAAQAHIDELLANNTQLEADLQAVHDELAELRSQVSEGADAIKAGGDADGESLQAQIEQLARDNQQLMADLQTVQEGGGAGEPGDGLALSQALADSQTQLQLLENRLSAMAEANPDALLVAELTDERDILQEELGAWLELADTPESLKSYLSQLETDLETTRRQVIEAQAGLGAETPVAADDQVAALALIDSLQAQLMDLQAEYEAEMVRLQDEAAAQLTAFSEQVALDQTEHARQHDEAATQLDALAAQRQLDQAEQAARAAEIATLQAALTDAQAQADTLNGHVESHQTAGLELAAVQAALAALQAEIDTLRTAGTTAETARTALTAEADTQVAELAVERERVAGLQAELTQLRDEQAASANQVAELTPLQGRIADLEAEIIRLHDEHDQAKNQLTDFHAASVDAVDVQDELVKAQAKLAELGLIAATAGAAHLRIADLENQLQTVQSDLDQAQARLLETTVVASQAAPAQTRIAELEAQLTTVQADLDEAQAHLVTATVAASQAGPDPEHVAALEARLADAQALAEQLPAATARAAAFEADIARIYAEQAEVVALETDVRHAQVEAFEIQEELQELQDEIRRLETALGEAQGKLALTDQALADNAGLQAEVARLTDAHNDATEQLLSLKAEQVHATQQLTELQRVEDIMVWREQEFATLRDAHETLTAQTAATHEELQAIRLASFDGQELEAEQRRANHLHDELDALRDERVALASALADAQAQTSQTSALEVEIVQLRSALFAAEAQAAEIAPLKAALTEAYSAGADSELLESLAGERDQLQAALAASQQQTGQVPALAEALRTLQAAQTSQQQEAVAAADTLERLAVERDVLAAEVTALREQQAPVGEQDPGYWRERAEAFEAKYQELYWQKALAEQESAEPPVPTAGEETALLQAELEQLQAAALQTKAEVDRLQAQLAEANRRSPDMDLTQVAMLGAVADDTTNEGLSKAIAKQLSRVSRSLAKLGLSRTGTGEATPAATETTLWVLGSADRGRQWADELSQYLGEYGLNLIWLSDPTRLPQPWIGAGLVLFSDEPASEPWALTAKERQVPLLMLEPTNLIRLKIAVLDRFIRK
ncbi:MAG: hypothetical protein H7338_23910 [Candidatus Sericytochromatia bacterium]|nr:hypothetical protein [Candidatus Sericytochromatia bacterium]